MWFEWRHSLLSRQHVLPLNPADQSPEQPHHARKVQEAPLPDRILLAQVGDGIHDGAEQHQPVSQQDVTGCEQEKETRNYHSV